MRRLDLKVGFSCNCRCTFCVQGDKRFRYEDKTLDLLKHLIKKNFERGIREIVLTGGECTIRHDLLDAVAYAKKVGYTHIQIQSNGRRFYYLQYCKAAIAAGVSEFALSLHGSKACIHDSLTQAPGSFYQIVRGIRNLKQLNQRVLLNTVITTHNYRDLPRLAQLLVSLHADQFQLAFIHILGSASDNKGWIVPRKSEVMPFVKKALQIGKEAGIRVMSEAIPYCFMQGYEDCVAERIIPDTRVEDAAWSVENFTQHRITKGKVKNEKCRSCRYDAVCEGPWKEYPQQYGWEEFKPVAGEMVL